MASKAIREMRIKATVIPHYCQDAKASKREVIENCGETVESGKHLYTLSGHINWHSHYRKQNKNMSKFIITDQGIWHSTHTFHDSHVGSPSFNSQHHPSQKKKPHNRATILYNTISRIYSKKINQQPKRSLNSHVPYRIIYNGHDTEGTKVSMTE